MGDGLFGQAEKDRRGVDSDSAGEAVLSVVGEIVEEEVTRVLEENSETCRRLGRTGSDHHSLSDGLVSLGLRWS